MQEINKSYHTVMKTLLCYQSSKHEAGQSMCTVMNVSFIRSN